MQPEIKMKCTCCRRVPENAHEGVLIQGWLTSLKAKFTQEGRPCVLFFCKACLDAGKVDILEWNANRYPIRVREANGNLIIEAPVADLEPGPAGPAAARPEALQLGHKPMDPLADVPRQQSQPAPQVPQGGEKKTPAPTPPSPAMPPVQKPGVSGSGGVCSPCPKCQKEVSPEQGRKSERIHGIKLCQECDAVETARVIEIMKANKAAGKPYTHGIAPGSTRAIAPCMTCGGLVNADDKKASALFFGKILCRECFTAEKAAKAAAKEGVKT